MNAVPAKVFAVVGLETGLFLGMGVVLFHTVRVLYTATKQHAWSGFRSL
jgi:hypothetical protein